MNKRLFSLLFLFLVPGLVFAQQNSSANPTGVKVGSSLTISHQAGVAIRGDFQVSPTRFVLQMNPGEQRTVEIQVASREGKKNSYEIGVEDFSVTNDGTDEIQFYGNGSGPFSAKSWITPAQKKFTLEHGDRAFVPIKISIPANAAVGDHYSLVTFQRAQGEEGGMGFNIIPRVGALLLITVNGDLVRQGTLENFTSSSRLYWSLPAKFSLQYRNTGTVHIVPTGHVEIKNIFGIAIDDVAIKDWYVLRNSLRRREILWQPHFALGYYTATLFLDDKEGQAHIDPIVLSFWMVPALPVLIALLVIFTTSLLVQVFFSRFELKKKPAK